MKLIAHRGLVDGPDKNLENHPDQIDRAVAHGFECEVDLSRVDNRLYLGHDEPTYVIEPEFLYSRPLWIHAKNLAALEWLTATELNYFWHQNDDYVITSKGYIWAYPGQPLSPRSIQVLPEWAGNLEGVDYSVSGVCSDWVNLIQAQVPKSLQ